MQKIIKRIFLIVFALSVTVFTLMGYAQTSIPDEINISNTSNVYSGAIFTYEISNGKKLASTDPVDADVYELNVRLFDAIPVKKTKVLLSKRKYVTVSGDVFGIKMYTDGVMVVANETFIDPQGSQVSPGEAAGVKPGDIIRSVDTNKVDSSAELSDIISSSNGGKVVLSIVRDGKTQKITIQPIINKDDGKYKIGLWVRDSTAGIGTMTFFDRENGIFAGLGHAVCDVDTGFTMPIADGDAVNARIKGCYKGKPGMPGELIGSFDSGSIGKLYYNGETGVYGKLDSFDRNSAQTPVAVSDEIQRGKAEVICTVDDSGKQNYTVEIERVYKTSSTVKNMVVKITDERLLSLTGGIVQGMSGTPIIQNGMFIGAITHVFVNDPTRGYAIFAENMIVTAQDVYSDFLKKAS